MEFGATRLLLQWKAEALGFQGAETMLFLIFPRGLKPESLCPPARRLPVPAPTSRALFVQAGTAYAACRYGLHRSPLSSQSDKHEVRTGAGARKTHATPERAERSGRKAWAGFRGRGGQRGGCCLLGTYSRTQTCRGRHWLTGCEEGLSVRLEPAPFAMGGGAFAKPSGTGSVWGRGLTTRHYGNNNGMVHNNGGPGPAATG